MIETSKKGERVNDIFFGPLERPALAWLCEHMPRWVTPDHLTLVGVFAGLLIGVGYWLTNLDRNYLWLVNAGFILNWFGDSLDGNLARYRKTERPKYGYFVDHTVDAITTACICIGVGSSPYVGMVYALFDLSAYLTISILVYIKTNVTGVFTISYGKFGPTEMRVMIMIVNTVFFFGTNPLLALGSNTIPLYDLIAVIVAVLIFLYFIIFAAKQALELAKQEPARKQP
jgi:phosphatidylglycerophosphate synthase